MVTTARNRRVNLVDDYLFRGNRGLRTASASSSLTNAVEKQVLSAVRPRIRKIVIGVVDDIRTFYRRSGNAYNIMRYQGIRVEGTVFRNLRVRIIGPEYIKVLEEGGTMRPRNSDYLAIPLPPQFGGEGARPDGTPKLPGPRSWKNVVNTFTLKAKSGKLYIAYRRGGQVRLLYALVKMVRITGKRRIARAYAIRRPQMEALLNREIQTAFFQYVDNPKRHLLTVARITTRGRR